MKLLKSRLWGLCNLFRSLLWGVYAVGLLCLGNIFLEFAREEMLETRKYTASSEIELWFGALFAFLTAFVALAAFVGGLSAVYLGASLLDKRPEEVGDVLHGAANDLAREEGPLALDKDSERNPKNEWVLKMLRDLPTEHRRGE